MALATEKRSSGIILWFHWNRSENSVLRWAPFSGKMDTQERQRKEALDSMMGPNITVLITYRSDTNFRFIKNWAGSWNTRNCCVSLWNGCKSWGSCCSNQGITEGGANTATAQTKLIISIYFTLYIFANVIYEFTNPHSPAILMLVLLADVTAHDQLWLWIKANDKHAYQYSKETW